MSNVDLERIKQRNTIKSAVQLDKNEWIFDIQACPFAIKVHVVKQRDGTYLGITSHKIMTASQREPYINLVPQETKQKALESAILGFLKWWNPSRSKETKLFRYDYYPTS